MKNPVNVLRAGVACVILSFPLIAMTVYEMMSAMEEVANDSGKEVNSAAVEIADALPYGMIGGPLLLVGVIVLIVGLFLNRRSTVPTLRERI